MILQRFLIAAVLIVPSLVGVEYQTFPGVSLSVGLFQHVHDHLQVRMVRYRVADDFPVVHVEYRRQVALFHADVYLGHVGCPLPVRARRAEVPVQDVGRSLANFALVRAVLIAFSHVFQVFLFH